jgi:hypothetical protein
MKNLKTPKNLLASGLFVHVRSSMGPGDETDGIICNDVKKFEFYFSNLFLEKKDPKLMALQRFFNCCNKIYLHTNIFLNPRTPRNKAVEMDKTPDFCTSVRLRRVEISPLPIPRAFAEVSTMRLLSTPSPCVSPSVTAR